MNQEKQKEQWKALYYINNNENEREIDLLDCLFSVCEKWRSLVLVGLVLLLLVGAAKFFTGWVQLKEDEALIAAGRETEVSYYGDVEAGLKKAKEKWQKISETELLAEKAETNISRLENKIRECENNIQEIEKGLEKDKLSSEAAAQKLELLRTYRSESVLMQLDPTARPTAQRIYQVSVDTEGLQTALSGQDPCDGIAAAYEAAMKQGQLASLVGKYRLSEKYVRELIDVESDPVSNTICVKASGKDEAMARDILNEAAKIMESETKAITVRYQPHILKKISENYTETIDTGLMELQAGCDQKAAEYAGIVADAQKQERNATTEIESQKITIEEYQRQIKGYENQITVYEDEIETLKKDEEKLIQKAYAQTPTKKSILKSALKYGLIVAVIAAVVLAVIYGLIYLLDGKMHTDSDLAKLYNLPLFALFNYRERKNACVIDRLLRKLFRREAVVSDEEILKTAAVSINECTEEGQKIALLGSCNEEELRDTCESLERLLDGIKIVPVVGSIISADSAGKLSELDAVILFETRNLSTLKAIDAEMQQIVVYGKPVLGCIVA